MRISISFGSQIEFCLSHLNLAQNERMKKAGKIVRRKVGTFEIKIYFVRYILQALQR